MSKATTRSGRAARLAVIGLMGMAAIPVFLTGCSDSDAQVDTGDHSATANGSDLRRGGVFAMSNAPDANQIVAYARDADGSLSQVGLSPTGGAGSSSFEDSANGLVLATVDGEIAPNNIIEPDDNG